MDAVRTCVGCRTRDSRSALLRVIATESRLVIDETGSASGRGAWVHLNRSCAEQAIQRRAFVRALRVPGPLDTQALKDRLNDYGTEVNGSK